MFGFDSHHSVEVAMVAAGDRGERTVFHDLSVKGFEKSDFSHGGSSEVGLYQFMRSATKGCATWWRSQA
jgi:hypothetical protein